MLNGENGSRVTVRFFAPAPELRPYFSTYYLTEVTLPDGEVIADWLHPEWANMRFSHTDGWLAAIGTEALQPAPKLIATGPTCLAAHFVAGSKRSWGIGMLPLGWARFVDAAAKDYTDRFVDGQTDPAFARFAPLLEQIFAGHSDPQGEAARIDAYLLALLKSCPPADEEGRISTAHAALMDSELATVADLADRLGMSSRSLERLSLRAFGFSPKLLLRRQRFLRSMGQFMLDPSLTWLSTLDWHYHDQAHFVRDFRRFMTMSPSQYAALDHPVMRAAAQARTAAFGAPVQALHQSV